MPCRLIIAVLAFLPDVAGAQASPLARAGWLAGCWELRAPNRVTLEMWMPPLGDLMLGASRTTVGTATSEFEQLKLKAEGDKIVYIAAPSGRTETSFPSTTISDTLIVFENTAHDFPQRIIYRRRGADSLVARIEGPGPNGPRGINFPMRRSNCLTVAPPTPPDTVVMSADLSPDQKQMLVARGAAPNIDVFLYDASGTPVRKLTDQPNFDYQPRWSPDGQRLVYVSVRKNRQVIFTMRPDGSEPDTFRSEAMIQRRKVPGKPVILHTTGPHRFGARNQPDRNDCHPRPQRPRLHSRGHWVDAHDPTAPHHRRHPGHRLREDRDIQSRP